MERARFKFLMAAVLSGDAHGVREKTIRCIQFQSIWSYQCHPITLNWIKTDTLSKQDPVFQPGMWNRKETMYVVGCTLRIGLVFHVTE